jgi:hypothetical protein
VVAEVERIRLVLEEERLLCLQVEVVSEAVEEVQRGCVCV